MNSVKFLFIFSGLLLVLMFSACSKNQTSFSEMPGFKDYFAKNIPSEVLPSRTEQALLTKFRPRIYMAKGQTQGIDFYADYIHLNAAGRQLFQQWLSAELASLPQ